MRRVNSNGFLGRGTAATLAAMILAVITGLCHADATPDKTQKTSVFDLHDVEQAPQIIKGTQKLPEYPVRSGSGIAGEVTVEFVVDAGGNVRNARVVSSSAREYEAPAIRAVQQWKFTPGRKDGKNVATRMRIPIAFNLSDEE